MTIPYHLTSLAYIRHQELITRCVCQCNVLCKLHANVSEVKSVQRITTKFQTHDNVSEVIVSGGKPENLKLLYFLSVLMFWC